MTHKLPAAKTELKRWRDEGLILPVWWRDDDATAPTTALERLLALAERFAAPLHLAVVPQPATPDLAERLQDAGNVFVLVHGWKHINHAPPDEKKAEFGPHRDMSIILDDVCAGRERLLDLFGELALPIFTPPWNRIAPELVEKLAGTDFKALSTFTPRSSQFAAPGLLQVNTHLDPIAWKAGGGLLDPLLLDAQLARELQDRRTARADNAEPYGLLTHHLVQDDATWGFMETLLEVFAASGVARWTPPFRTVG